jgi:hypothetical protein
MNSTETLFSDSEMPQHQLAVVPANPAELIREVIKSGLNSESVGVVERLVALAERQEARQAEKDFNAAFNALQSEMPSVVADREVPDKQGNLKYKFAAFEDIMAQVKPLLLKNGFSLSFSMDFKEGRVIQQCRLSHSGGHSRTNTFMARPGSGPPGSSEAQGDGAASTYAKRFALCNALNIVCERDTDGADARKEGAPITEDQALYLEDLVKQTKSDKAAFLKYAGAASYNEIGSERFDQLSRSLNKKLSGL